MDNLNQGDPATHIFAIDLGKHKSTACDFDTFPLVDDPAHARALAEHRALLDTHREQTDDPFFSLEYQVDARWREHTPGYTSHTGPAAPMLG